MLNFKTRSWSSANAGHVEGVTDFKRETREAKSKEKGLTVGIREKVGYRTDLNLKYVANSKVKLFSLGNKLLSSITQSHTPSKCFSRTCTIPIFRIKSLVYSCKSVFIHIRGTSPYCALCKTKDFKVIK